jgi:hypothetical protein
MRFALFALAMPLGFAFAGPASASPYCDGYKAGYLKGYNDHIGPGGRRELTPPIMCDDKSRLPNPFQAGFASGYNDGANLARMRAAGLERQDSWPPPDIAPNESAYCAGYRNGFRRGYCRSNKPCRGERAYCRGERTAPPTYDAGFRQGLDDANAKREASSGFPANSTGGRWEDDPDPVTHRPEPPCRDCGPTPGPCTDCGYAPVPPSPPPAPPPPPPSFVDRR